MKKKKLALSISLALILGLSNQLAFAGDDDEDPAAVQPVQPVGVQPNAMYASTLNHDLTVAGVTATTDNGKFKDGGSYTEDLTIANGETGPVNIPGGIEFMKNLTVEKGGTLTETGTTINAEGNVTVSGNLSLKANTINLKNGLEAKENNINVDLTGGINSRTNPIKIHNGAIGTIIGLAGQDINTDIEIGQDNDAYDASSVNINTNGSNFNGNITVNNVEHNQAVVWVNGGNWTGNAVVSNADKGIIDVTVDKGSTWIGKTDSTKAPNSVHLHLDGGTFINTDNTPNGKIGSIKGNGRVEIAQIVPVGAAIPDSTTLEVKNLDAKSNINFVARSSFGKAGGKEDTLSILNVVNGKDANTPSNSNLTIVAPLDLVYKQFEEDKKANTPSKIIGFKSNTDNPVFTAGNIMLEEKGFTSPVFEIKKGNDTFIDVLVVGKKDSDIFDAIKANATGVYDLGVASRVLLDRALHRNELINKQDGNWARYKNIQTGVDKKFSTVGNAFEIGYNKVFGNYQNGATIELGRDNFEYKDSFAGNGKFQSTLIGAYHTQFLPESAYLDYSVKFGKTKSDVTIQSQKDYKNKFSVNEAIAAVEYGKEIKANEKLSYIPQVQLQYAHMGDSDFTNEIGRVNLSSVNSLIARTGVDVNYKLADKLTLMSSFNALHEFAGKQTISARGQSDADSTSARIDNSGTWYAVGLGVNYTSEKINAYAHVDKLFGNDKNKDTQVNVGVKYLF